MTYQGGRSLSFSQRTFAPKPSQKLRVSNINSPSSIYLIPFNIVQLKPYACAFSSIFSVFHILQLSSLQDQGSTTLKDMISEAASQYCSKLNDLEIAKIELISILSSLDHDDKEAFTKECTDALDSYSQLSNWIDPIIVKDLHNTSTV